MKNILPVLVILFLAGTLAWGVATDTDTTSEPCDFACLEERVATLEAAFLLEHPPEPPGQECFTDRDGWQCVEQPDGSCICSEIPIPRL